MGKITQGKKIKSALAEIVLQKENVTIVCKDSLVFNFQGILAFVFFLVHSSFCLRSAYTGSSFFQHRLICLDLTLGSVIKTPV